MPPRFEFATAGRIVFGAGTLAEIGNIAREFGRHALVVTGGDQQRAAPLLDQLARVQIATTVFAIDHEPATADIIRGRARTQASKCDFVIGFGGGSALDSAKAISALMTNQHEIFNYLEVIGRGQPLANPAAPCLAIPTTAGTGAEVTRNAVLSATGHNVKVSLRGAHMLPRVALIDPELTYTLPPAVTASTGLDALTQLIEPYVSCRATPLTDALCVDGIRRAARSLRRAFDHGHDAAAREDMSIASLFGGLALANAGLGAVHGFAGPIGGAFPAPHGGVCAALLAPVMATNLAALRARAPSHDALRRYEEIARLVTARPQATADDSVKWVRDLVAALGIPPLATYGLTRAATATIVPAAARASSMKANPLPLTPEELTATLEAAI